MAWMIRFKATVADSGNPNFNPSPEPPELPDVVPDRVRENVLGKFEEVVRGQARKPRLMKPDHATTFSEEYIQGDFYFSDSEDLDDLIDAIERDVVGDAEAYRIEPYESTHDQPDGGRCTLLEDKVVEHGDIPDGW